MPYNIAKITVKNSFDDSEDKVFLSQNMSREDFHNSISNLVGKKIIGSVATDAYTNEELKVKWQEAVAKNNTEMGFGEWVVAGVKFGHFITERQVKEESW